MNKPGRPPVITNEIAQIIAKMKDRHSNWSVREYEQKFDDFAPRELKGKGPGRTALNDYINKMNLNVEKMGIERAWSSAELNNENINPESVRWLIALQVYRKSYYSKPLTVREAKWFSFLSGFRGVFSQDLTDFGLSPQLKDVFISSVLATWAELYAYREKIDTMAGIKNPDYSDLDNNLANLDFEAIYKYNDVKLFDAIGEITNRDDINKENLEDFNEQYLLPSLIDQIRFQEMRILAHSLGEPDMTQDSIRLYSGILTSILADNPTFFDALFKIPHIKRIHFLSVLRNWVKENPDVTDDQVVNSKIHEILTDVKKDGESNG